MDHGSIAQMLKVLEGSLRLLFSLNQVFTSDLNNPASPGFKNLANTLIAVLNKIFRNTPSFRRSILNSFKSGSVISNMTLVFSDKASVPPIGNVTSTFLNNINATGLSIVQGSVSFNSGNALGPTSFSLAALLLTLSLVMVQLITG
ncbi:hypothetical protein DPEC_G00187000 [Dallia pectoralis]|uniref:Uncharacterized protein n=1 Tax=Dallia pectoralis TaxID=75939 RepID=A0ACC2GBM0_DALPE|nr:hypothetical protein DPEC_G00187000 [Dallia pectoralis]